MVGASKLPLFAFATQTCSAPIRREPNSRYSPSGVIVGYASYFSGSLTPVSFENAVSLPSRNGDEYRSHSVTSPEAGHSER